MGKSTMEIQYCGGFNTHLYFFSLYLYLILMADTKKITMTEMINKDDKDDNFRII